MNIIDDDILNGIEPYPIVEQLHVLTKMQKETLEKMQKEVDPIINQAKGRKRHSKAEINVEKNKREGKYLMHVTPEN